MRIIPAIDIIEGKCVRLTKGDYSTQKVYNENPVELAMQFNESGIKYLHLVDLDGAKAQKLVNLSILEQICSKTSLWVDYGGGIRTNEDINKVLNSGAQQVNLGSAAAKNPSFFIEALQTFGADKIMLSADSMHKHIAIHGWQTSTTTTLIDFIKQFEKHGLQYAVCTDILVDGMLTGPNLDLYQEVMEQCAIKLIASGGIATLNDLIALKKLGCEGAILGKALYENRIGLKDLATLC